MYQTDGPGDASGMLSLREHLPGRYDRGFGVFEADGRDETDACQVVVAEAVPNCRSATDDMLSCPKCHQAFLRNRHLELLEHMEECQ